MNATLTGDVWADGLAYEPYVGRWSRLVAREFLDWLAVPAGRDWLDVGTGTGALLQTILQTATPRSLCGVEPSAGYVAYGRRMLAHDEVHLTRADARALPFRAAAFDAVASGLVINFIPEPDAAISDMARVVRPGGVVGAYVWDYAEGMQLMRYFWDAAAALDPGAAEKDEGRRFPICRPDALAQLFERAGLRDVQTRAVEVPTVFKDFDDYWDPFLGGQGPAPGYAVALDEARRSALREHLRGRLPVAGDGSIPLTARAWAVSGRVT